MNRKPNTRTTSPRLYRKDKPTYCTAASEPHIRYRAREDAGKAIRSRRALGAGFLRSYKCPSCKGYHITSWPQERYAASLRNRLAVSAGAAAAA